MFLKLRIFYFGEKEGLNRSIILSARIINLHLERKERREMSRLDQTNFNFQIQEVFTTISYSELKTLNSLIVFLYKTDRDF